MKPDARRDEIAPPTPKAPYERPALTKVGRLRDVTAQTKTADAG